LSIISEFSALEELLIESCRFSALVPSSKPSARSFHRCSVNRTMRLLSGFPF
jgi:hypothetical protein